MSIYIENTIDYSIQDKINNRTFIKPIYGKNNLLYIPIFYKKENDFIKVFDIFKDNYEIIVGVFLKLNWSVNNDIRIGSTVVNRQTGGSEIDINIYRNLILQKLLIKVITKNNIKIIEPSNALKLNPIIAIHLTNVFKDIEFKRLELEDISEKDEEILYKQLYNYSSGIGAIPYRR